MKQRNLKAGVGWAFMTIALGLTVLIVDGLDVKDGKVSFSLDNANPEVIALASGLMVTGTGIRVFPEKVGGALPDSPIVDAIGGLLTGISKNDD